MTQTNKTTITLEGEGGRKGREQRGIKIGYVKEDKKEEGRITKKKERKKVGNTSFKYGRTKKKKKKRWI